MIDQDSQQPGHIGIIMDGNRRWAQSRGLPVLEGHRQGYKNLKVLLRTLKECAIPYVSVYAFSTENWTRTQDEVDGLMKLLRWVLTKELTELMKEERKIVFLGSKTNVPADIVTLMQDVERKTADFSEGTLAICFNYGGQQEVVDAARAIVAAGQEITAEHITNNLYHPELPEIDLVIRTSGEHRTSNFMLWRASYAELAFTNTLWPDFSPEELRQLIADYASRHRRFGS